MSSVSDATQSSSRFISAFLRTVAIPILAIFTALVVASVAMIASGTNPIEAYLALAEGAFGSQKAIIETLIKATPFIFTALGIGLAFRGGLFNIGAEGQLWVGSIVAVWLGYSVPFLPGIIHLPLVLLGGMAGGAAWAFIPGYLKARSGAHEVITTIMTNFIAQGIVSWLIISPSRMQAPGTAVPETQAVLESGRLPLLIPDTRLHAGVVVALLTAGVVYWLLWRTVIGFELRTVGSNPEAARYAGINVEGNIIRTMMISGSLAGLAGAVQVAGLPPHVFTIGFNPGLGFDSIAVAVLGSLHPVGIVLGSLLFGAMDSGARLMQLRTKVPIDIITIVQGLVLMFVAANQIIRTIYRIRGEGQEGPVNLGQLWGGGD